MFRMASWVEIGTLAYMLLQGEIVLKLVSRSDRALINHGSTIGPVTSFLEQSVPML